MFAADGTRPLTVTAGTKLTHTDDQDFEMSDMTPADLGSPWAGSIQTRTLEAKGTSPVLSIW